MRVSTRSGKSGRLSRRKYASAARLLLMRQLSTANAQLNGVQNELEEGRRKLSEANAQVRYCAQLCKLTPSARRALGAA